jgi:hypothetical protein
MGSLGRPDSLPSNIGASTPPPIPQTGTLGLVNSIAVNWFNLRSVNSKSEKSEPIVDAEARGQKEAVCGRNSGEA